MATIELDLIAATEHFVREFAVFEKHFVGLALRSLSNDASFVEHVELLLGLEGRLTLLKRMAIVQQMDPDLIAQLEDIQLRARSLLEKRDELAQALNLVAADKRGSLLPHPPLEDAPERNFAIARRPQRVWVPTMGEIDECRKGTNRLQSSLGSIATHLSSCRELRSLV
jgi:hypothetical protein